MTPLRSSRRLQYLPRGRLTNQRPTRPRFFSSNGESSSPEPHRIRVRLQSLNSRLPSFLQRYTTPLLGAPVTHITSFLILHEITAIVPLFALVGAFHYGGWLPSFAVGSAEDGNNSNSAFDEGVKKFGKWLRKRGWVDEEQQMRAIKKEGDGDLGLNQAPNHGVRLILEFATAYAVTKALLPVRVAASVWATRWFARNVLVPTGRVMGRLFRKS